MLKKHPKFTIVIPTRERAPVLEASLRTAIAQDYDNLEIIVSDNFSNDDTEEIVKSHKDPRIKYINTGKRLSMSHNWEFALSHIMGGWVTFLGDDDGILPNALEKVVEIAEETGVKAIRSSSCSYIWPLALGKDYGHLVINLGKGYDIRISEEWLLKVMSGLKSYTCLPMLYNCGFVDYNLITEIRSVTGSFYHSMTPDVYSAIVFSRFTDRYVYSYEPFAINGASAFSGGTSAFGKGGLSSSEMSPAKQFWSEPNIPFHTDLPLLADGTYPLSLEAIVYESYLQSNCLGKECDPYITHDKQLEIILRNAPNQRRENVFEWGKLFAARHNLNYEGILKRSKKFNYKKKINSFWGRVGNGFDNLILGSPQIPIRDVYDASIAAAAIIDSKPCKLGNFVRRTAAKIGTFKTKDKIEG